MNHTQNVTLQEMISVQQIVIGHTAICNAIPKETICQRLRISERRLRKIVNAMINDDDHNWLIGYDPNGRGYFYITKDTPPEDILLWRNHEISRKYELIKRVTNTDKKININCGAGVLNESIRLQGRLPL